MLNKIIHFALHNRIAILALSILLMMAGAYTVSRMEVDVFPDLNAPTVVVMTEAKGMAPEEVERLVTFPIETAVNGATDVRRVRSSSTMGFSVVWVEFDWGTDIFIARQIVSEKISMVSEALPPTAGVPTLGPQSSILGEVMLIALTADSTVSQQELRTLADWTFRPRLLATGGVAQVSVQGGETREYQILLNPDKMRHFGISLDEVTAAVADMNRNTSGGILYEHGNEYLIRGMISTNDIEALGMSVVKMVDDLPILLSHVAEIKVGNHSPRTGVASHNTHPAVMMTVTKQPSISTLTLTEKIDSTLAEIQKELPEGVQVATDIYRQERFIRSSIDNVTRALLEGSIFVIIVLFIFLMNFRTTFISLITIPLSLVVAVLVLYAFGLTINTMSLGGLAIAIGALVDDAIVDVENIYKRLRENKQLPPGEQRTNLTVIYEASREVRLPILNSTLIIITGFIPLFFLSGMEGRMLVPLGIAFIAALFASTLVALTVTPVLSSYLLDSRSQKMREPAITRKMKALYIRKLTWSIRHMRPILIIASVVIVLTVVLFTTLGRSFLPPFNEGSFTINVATLPGVSLKESDKIGRDVERILLEIPEIECVGRKTGRAELDEHALGVNSSEIEAPFHLSKRSKEEVREEVRERLAAIPGIAVEVGAPITHRIDAMLSGTRAGIAIKLFGHDLNKMYSLGNEIKGVIADIDGITDLNVEQQVERPQLKITPKRELMAKYGISLPEFAESVSILLGGEVVSQVFEGDKAFDLLLKVDDDNRSTMERIADITIDAAGQKVPLSHIAHVSSAMGPNTINRENVSRKVVISANASGRGLTEVVGEIRDRIESDITLPEGYHIEYGGQFESEQAASRTLAVASIFAIIVIFLLLYGQFGSTRQAGIILINLPLALIGGVYAIWLGDGIVSIPSIIGFISLFGIATRNGMLLVERFNDLRRQGYSTLRAILSGSADRLTPIMMTTFTTALALIPLVIGGELPGNEIQSPMAKVILGGLITSTLLNAIIVPIVYLITSSPLKNSNQQ